MKGLGCLVLILIILAGLFVVFAPGDLSDRQKAQWAGRKVHRGWNQVRNYAENVREGWKSVPDENRGTAGGQ